MNHAKKLSTSQVDENNSTTKVNFISDIPSPVPDMILEMLPPEELEKCLDVSQDWWYRANKNYLWRKHCIDVRRIYKKIEGNGLCEFYNLWSSFRKSKEYKWKNKSWKSIESIKLPFVKYICGTDMILEVCENNLTAKKFSKMDEVFYNFEFPFFEVKFYKINHRFAVFIFKNIMFVFNCYGGFGLSKIIAISESRVFIYNDKKESIKSFVDNFLSHRTVYEILDLFNNCLLFKRKKSNVANVINLKTEKLYSHIFTLGSGLYYIRNGYVINFRPHRDVTLWEFKTNHIIYIIGDMQSFLINWHTLLIYYFPEFHEERIQVWDLKTEQIIVYIPRYTFSNYKLNNSEEILYQILEKEVTAICTRSGNTIWNIHLPVLLEDELYLMKLVCQRYLVLYLGKSQTENHDTFHVIDTFNGTLWYSAKRPSGCVLQFNSSFMLTKSCNKLSILNFN